MKPMNCRCLERTENGSEVKGSVKSSILRILLIWSVLMLWGCGSSSGTAGFSGQGGFSEFSGLPGPGQGNVGPGTGNPVDFGGGGGGEGAPISFLLFADPTPNGGGGSVVSVAVFSDGFLSVVDDEANGGRPLGVDVAPNQDFLYTSNAGNETIVPFIVDRLTGGVLPNGNPISADLGASLDAVQRIFVHPSGNFAYATHFNSAVSSYLLAVDGTISENLASPPIDQHGRFTRFTFGANGDRIYAVDGDLGTITIFTVNLTNGILDYLTPPPNEFFPSGLLSPSDSVLSRDGDFLYVSDSEGDVIQTYTIDINGGLVPATSVATDEGPGFLALHPTLPVLYSANSANSINIFTTGAGGVLAPLGASVSTVPGVRQILVDPSGEFLFAYETEGEIYAYAVGATGELTFLNSYDFFELTSPRDAKIVPALTVEEPLP